MEVYVPGSGITVKEMGQHKGTILIQPGEDCCGFQVTVWIFFLDVVSKGWHCN